MKRIYIGFALVAGLAMASCSEDWLNVDPSTSMNSEDAVKSVSDLRFAMNGVYRLASAHSYYGDNYLYFGDCRGADVQARIPKGSGGRVSAYYEYNAISTDNFNSGLPWYQAYKVIRQANNIIKAVNEGKVQTNDKDTVDAIKAEALVMRGLALYDLTRVFAVPYMADNGASPGVPIILTPTEYSDQPERATVAKCYERAIQDISDALGDLSREKTDGRMNYWAAQALLSRIYLNMGDNQNAYNAAIDVIENSKSIYRLYTTEEYPNVWGKDFQSESLFEFYFTQNEPAGGSGGEGAPMVYADMTLDWNNLVLTKDFLDLLDEDPDDVRHCITKMPVSVETDTLPVGSKGKPKYMGKYPGKTEGNPKDNNLCIVRLSEVYLNAAEAGFKLGNEYADQGLVYLNEIVKRANPVKSVSKDEFTLERILKERRKELVGEGLAVYDYTRNKLTIERVGGWHLINLSTADATSIPYNDSRHAVPIPQGEQDANDNI